MASHQSRMKSRLPLSVLVSALLMAAALVGFYLLTIDKLPFLEPTSPNSLQVRAGETYLSKQTHSDAPRSANFARSEIEDRQIDIEDRQADKPASASVSDQDHENSAANPSEYAAQNRWKSTVVPCWHLRGTAPEGYEVSLDRDIRTQGELSASIESIPQTIGFGTLYRFADATPFRGKRIEFSADVRMSVVSNSANLFLRADDANGRALAMDNERSLTGDLEWTTERIVIDIPSDAKVISYGVALVGQGKVWIDGLRLEIASTDVPITGSARTAPMLEQVTPFPLRHAVGDPKNLDFESTAPCHLVQSSTPFSGGRLESAAARISYREA